jgi:hypothetical protein
MRAVWGNKNLSAHSSEKVENFGRYGQKADGRYRPPDSAAHYGLGKPPNNRVRTKVGAVPDPRERGKASLATVNRDVDVLRDRACPPPDRSGGYLAGRALKRAYERLPAASSGSNWRGGDRVDPVAARDRKEDRTLDAIAAVEALEARAREVIGHSGVAFLSRILRDGWSFAELAARGQAKGGRGDIARVADGGGGGPPRIDPIIQGLLSRLPRSGDVWPEADRKLWLQLLEGSFKLIYRDKQDEAAN